ncbi:MAG: hypothetical protein NC121_13470 [Blautia sp.]|nr:hypothetical protein [Blautia sp.]
MKRLSAFKKALALTVSALMLAVLPDANALTASAEEPATYYVMYQGGDLGWCYQEGSTWDDTTTNYRRIYYLGEVLKAGDAVVVGSGGPADEPLTFNVHLGNLTIANNADSFAVVSVTGGMDSCYFLSDAHGAVTGDVFNGYVYNTATANFNSNVTNLYSYNTVPDSGPTIGVAGTVAYYMSEDTWRNNSPYGINFDAKTFLMEEGGLKTPEYNYTRDASGGPVASAAAPAAQPAAQPAAPGSSADEYDEVPKTGDASPVTWLSLIAVSCACASLLLKKSGNQ